MSGFDFITDFLGYSSPNQRAGEGFFGKPTYLDESTGQEIPTMSVQGLQKFVQLHPEATYGPAFARISQNVMDMETLKRQQEQDAIAKQQAERLAAQDAAAQESIKIDENKREGIRSMFAAFGPEKASQLVSDYGNLYSLPKDIVERTQKVADVATGQANALQKEGVQFSNQQTLEGIKQGNKLAENVQQAGLTRETNRIQAGLTLKNQKEIEKYKADLDEGKPAKPPAGFIDTGGGKVAPIPGTPAHTTAITGLNSLNGTLSLIDKYGNMARGGGNLFAGKAAQEADQLQGLLAQQIAQANNPGRAPTDADIEAARKLVPSITDVSDRVKGANKLKVLRDEFLKKQKQQFELVGHYPGAQDYTPELPAGFRIIK